MLEFDSQAGLDQISQGHFADVFPDGKKLTY